MYSIRVKEVTKVYQLYEKPIDRLKETLLGSKKCYHKDFFALDKVSFDVKKGETIGIIGTNGSGKSTILKIITGVLTPTSGEVEIEGKISALLELGAGFNSDYTGMENLYMNGTMMGYSKEEMEKKIPEILEFADIGDFVYQPVKTYSSGMFVRLAFALAINIDPEILIVDEALSVGDVFFQAKCFRKIDEIRKKGTTVLMVTHDLGSVIKYCNRVVLLNQGKYIDQGDAGKMVDLYKKILANQLNLDDDDEDQENEDVTDETNSGELWKDQLAANPNMSDYGNKNAEIIDYAICDSKGHVTNIINKGEKFEIKLKVKFNKTVNEPIFAFTLKDKKGTEITGTNSFIEMSEPVLTENKDVYEVSFKQSTKSMQGGEYLLSLGCTCFIQDELDVMHRMYDATYLTILSNKNTVGYFDIDSTVSVKKAGR